MLLKMLQHIFKRKYSTPSSSSLAHIITKPDSSNKSPSESGRFTAKCNRIPLLLPAHYHMSPTYTTVHVYMINKMGENGVDFSVVPLLPSGVNIILLFSYLL